MYPTSGDYVEPKKWTSVCPCLGVVQILLQHGGADILARNAQGNLPVHLAAAMGHFDMVVGGALQPFPAAAGT